MCILQHCCGTELISRKQFAPLEFCLKTCRWGQSSVSSEASCSSLLREDLLCTLPAASWIVRFSPPPSGRRHDSQPRLVSSQACTGQHWPHGFPESSVCAPFSPPGLLALCPSSEACCSPPGFLFPKPHTGALSGLIRVRTYGFLSISIRFGCLASDVLRTIVLYIFYAVFRVCFADVYVCVCKFGSCWPEVEILQFLIYSAANVFFLNDTCDLSFSFSFSPSCGIGEPLSFHLASLTGSLSILFFFPQFFNCTEFLAFPLVCFALYIFVM